jgi:hypothetical protein
MNKSRLLWVLVAANVLLAFASAGAEGFFGWTLPPPLAEYSRTRFSAFSIWHPGDLFHLALLATTVCFAFAAWIGLVTFWRYARRLYVVSCFFSMLLVLLSGPHVQTSVGAMFNEMSALVGGVIVGLIYFSDLARRFERTSAEKPAPAGMHLGADRA